MSSISPTAALPATGTSMPAGSLPLIDPAYEPAVIRNGDKKAQDAYHTGLAFENVLVNELAQQLSATVPGLDGSDDGLGGTSDDSAGAGGGGTGGGFMGGAGGLGAYSSLLPQTLASSVMQGGGAGLAMQIAKSIDPALGGPGK
jgi:hypothetical protein